MSDGRHEHHRPALCARRVRRRKREARKLEQWSSALARQPRRDDAREETPCATRPRRPASARDFVQGKCAGPSGRRRPGRAAGAQPPADSHRQRSPGRGPRDRDAVRGAQGRGREHGESHARCRGRARPSRSATKIATASQKRLERTVELQLEVRSDASRRRDHPRRGHGHRRLGAQPPPAARRRAWSANKGRRHVTQSF